MSEYTPPMEDLRRTYVEADTDNYEELRAGYFDRALAQHDAEVVDAYLERHLRSWKVSYTTIHGHESTAYIDGLTGEGEDKYTEKPVSLRSYWVEVAPDSKGESK